MENFRKKHGWCCSSLWHGLCGFSAMMWYLSRRSQNMILCSSLLLLDFAYG
jgi:hypothetical protein